MKQKTFNNKNINLVIFNLMHKYILRSLTGLLMSVIGTFAYLLLYFFIAKAKNNIGYFTCSIAAAISISSLTISLITIPAMNIEFRKSIFLRKLHLEGVSKYRYNFLLFLYFFLVQTAIILVAIIIFILLAYIGRKRDYLAGLKAIKLTTWWAIKNLSWGALLFSAFWCVVLNISVGMLISTFIKSSLFSQILGFGIFFLSLLFGGAVINIADWDDAVFMQYTSFFSPLSYPLIGMNITTTPSVTGIYPNLEKSFHSLFDFNSNLVLNKINQKGEFSNNDPSIYGWAKPIYAFMPIIFTGTSLSIAIWKFNFLSR